MERLDVLLVDVLHRHKTHGGPCHRLRDGLGIAAVVFIRLDIRLHELGRHELHLVAMCAEASRPIMCATTSFDADEHPGSFAIQGIRSWRMKSLGNTGYSLSMRTTA